ncbi:sensor histidine kinase [Parabacteroides bouchesdurhonensis]|uniref:HAMP domain-containing sensor histidine kinase n=1 Tax=Parabacteroides bouchesdurhonensis TaxID=1936995 RepID=UPI000E518114|nr:HAMP domain-containing sensor histidine kinase [Parabacteroides bouchesdurhonensis]RHJ93572.1 sensor histidine kinase [Bacteroides sp. AM07-16]
MKIRTKLTIQYTAVTAIIFLLTMCAIYFYSEHTRSETFYRNLKREAVTKAHLFLSGKVEAATMQSVYLNNRNFIDEVEVAIYKEPFEMLYHDAIQSDIVKETPEMIGEVAQKEFIQFYEGNYQAIGMLYIFHGNKYIVTAAAYDGYGYANLEPLKEILLALSVMGLTILLITGYLLARSALAPVKVIVRKMESISASSIGERLPVGKNEDELNELNCSFNRLLDDLEKAFHAQKLFVSNVSHELRTPMAALVAETELTLLKPRERERYENSLQNILQDARRIISLIDGLLNLAKADYNPNQIKMEKVRLDELLLDAHKTVIAAHPSYKVELVFEGEAEDDSVLTVYGNAYLLTTAFVNLIENNCKFSQNQTSIVQIGYWNELAIIRFSDNGIGISEADKKNLFTPFYRGENYNFSPGHGIGLALVHKIITLHKGEIEIHSRENEGTTFVVKFNHIGILA